VILGYVVVDIFPEHVDSPDHPSVCEFRRILEKIMMPYGCSLTQFTVSRGVAIFQFDKNEMTMDILEDLKKAMGVKAIAYGGDDLSIEKIKQLLKKPGRNR
jgi:hypothetical protein